MSRIEVARALAELDDYDAALTATRLRREGVDIFEHAPRLLHALLDALENRPPPPKGGGADVIVLEEERWRRRGVDIVVEGQGSPTAPVRRRRVLVESTHFDKAERHRG